MQIRAVIFDLGGVLVRTEDKGPRTALAARYGLTYAEMDKLVFDSPTGPKAALGEVTEEAHWQAVCASLGLGPDEIPAFQKEFWGGDRLDKGLVDYIRALRPRYKTALLSNAWTSLRTWLAERWRIADAFDEVIISCEVRLAKPDPRIYALVTERLGVAPGEAVFVDDWPPNIEGARRSGLHAVHFRDSVQARRELDALLDGKA